MAQFTMRDIARIGALLLTAVFMLHANGLQGTLVPVRAEAEGFSTFAISALGSGYFAGFVLGCVLCPMLIRRVGHIRGFAVFGSLTAVTILLHPMFVGVWAWIALRIAIGFFAAGMFAIIESWLHHQASNANRGRVFTTYATLNLLALIGGNFLFASGDTMGAGLFTLVAILTLLCLIPVSLTGEPEPARPKRQQMRIGRLYTLSPVGFMGSIAVGLAGGAFWSLAPVFAKERGLDTDGIALFMSAVILGGALAQWPMGRASDFTDRRIVMAIGALGAILAGLMLALSPAFGAAGVWVMYAGAMLHGATAFPIGSLSNAHLNDHAAKEEVTETATGVLFVYGAAAAIGPAFGGLAMWLWNVDGLFFYSAAVHALLLLFVIYRITQRAPATHEARPPASVLPLGVSAAKPPLGRS